MVLKRPWNQERMFWTFGKQIYSFWQVLSDEVETFFWGVEAKHETLFKSKFGHRNLLRKLFWSFLELKNQDCGRLKIAFFSFLQVFDWRSWNHFLRKLGKMFKFLKSNFGHRKLLRKWFWTTLSTKSNVLCVWKGLLSVFWEFLNVEVENVFWESETTIFENFFA